MHVHTIAQIIVIVYYFHFFGVFLASKGTYVAPVPVQARPIRKSRRQVSRLRENRILSLKTRKRITNAQIILAITEHVPGRLEKHVHSTRYS